MFLSTTVQKHVARKKESQYFVLEYFAYRVLMAQELKRCWSRFTSQRIKILFLEMCLPWSRVVSEWVQLFIFDDLALSDHLVINTLILIKAYLMLQEPLPLHPEDFLKRIL